MLARYRLRRRSASKISESNRLPVQAPVVWPAIRTLVRPSSWGAGPTWSPWSRIFACS